MTRTVKKGKHDFQPLDEAFFTASNKVEGHFVFDDSMYFTREDPDYPYGVDVEDWNKICGLTWFLTGNTNRTGMLVWRPNEEEENTFEIGTYINDQRGRVKWHHRKTVKAGERVEFQIIWLYNEMLFKLKTLTDEDYTFYYVPLPRPRWWQGPFYREIGPWFGGNRAAHKDMSGWLSRAVR